MPYLVVCSGIMRSASTWSYNVCRVLAHGTLDAEREVFFSGYSDETDKTLCDWLTDKRLNGRSVRGVLKSHQVGDQTRQAIARGKIANVFTIRDPRDAMFSMMNFGAPKGEDELAHLIGLFRHVLDRGMAYLDDGVSMVVRYEDMTADPLAAVHAIARYMRLDPGERFLEKTHRATQVENLKKIVERLEAETPPGEDNVEPATQLHVDHFHGGESGRWRTDLPPEMQARLHRAFEPYLAAYGYAATG